MTAKHVLVLQGGSSNERQVSLRSGANVAEHLRQAGYRVTTADPTDQSYDLNQLCAQSDVVLPMLHGAGGEDGSIQHDLEARGMPYLGSRPVACELTFNKVATKERLSEHGILTPQWEVVTHSQFTASPLTKRSFVLKPIAGGSTIDTLIAHNPLHQPLDEAAISDLFKRYTHMLLEELVEGQEITIGVLDDKALPVILIVPPPGEEFDYTNKYNGRTQEIVKPAQLSAQLQRRAQRLAVNIHELTGCRHMSRTDIIVAETGAMYVLETNTLPGMTTASLFPSAAKAAGIDMPELVKRFVTMAEQTHA